MNGRITDQAGYAGLARALACQALSIAVDTAPHRARLGELRWPIANALPAARVLAQVAGDDDRLALPIAARSLAQTLADPTGKVTDGFGHTRPSYALFVIHLLGTAAMLADDLDTLAQTRLAATTLLNTPTGAGHADDPRLSAWRRLIAQQHRLHQAEDLPLPSEAPAPLVPLGLNDLIDSWTYYELVGLHGLYLCSLINDDPFLKQRAESAALYHLGHTQPDYTTYQPWGLAAFAAEPATAMFAEQQLHDVATHLSIEGAGGAVMPALLLADAAATMAGRISSVWNQP